MDDRCATNNVIATPVRAMRSANFIIFIKTLSMKRYLVIVLFLFTQMLLWVVSRSEHIAMDSDILIETLVVGLFLMFHIIGLRWARWMAAALLGLVAILAINATLEGFGYGFLLVALMYISVILALFRISLRSNDRFPSGGLESQVLDSIPPPPPEPRAAEFQVGQEVYRYPLLLKRYQSVFIDFLLFCLLLIVAMVILGESPARQAVMLCMGILFTLVYEPFLTAYGATVGQYVIGIRVRDARNPNKRINILQAYVRIIVKLMLGWISFVTIHFNPQHRAIHDLAGSSVMIRLK